MPTSPNGTAGHFWTALWLLPDLDTCWPKGGEVDILESDIWGQQPPYAPHAAYHWSHEAAPCFKDAANNRDGGVPPPHTPKIDYSQDFHTYTAELTPRMIIFSVDGKPYYTATATKAEGVLPHTDMYLILGNQLWKNWNYPTELPAEFQVDYVKAWVPV
jgi:beta-glucanase (GH16 family)